MRQGTAERDELARLCAAGEHVAMRDRTHRDIGDDGLAVARRDCDGEWIRAGERRSARGVRQPARRGGRQERDEAPVGELPGPIAECAGGKRARADDEARPRRRVGELRRHDRRKRQVAERARAVPAFVARLGGNPDRSCGGIEARERLEPLDACQAMAGLPASLGREKVQRERLDVIAAKAERREPGTSLAGPHA